MASDAYERALLATRAARDTMRAEGPASNAEMLRDSATAM